MRTMSGCASEGDPTAIEAGVLICKRAAENDNRAAQAPYIVAQVYHRGP